MKKIKKLRVSICDDGKNKKKKTDFASTLKKAEALLLDCDGIKR